MALKKATIRFLSILLLIEIIARIEIHYMSGASFFSPGDIIYSYYPMIKNIEKLYSKTDTGSYKILILSCSTLHREWGQFDSILTAKLSEADTSKYPGSNLKYTVFNASGVGFSSQDNLNCYKLLSNKKFDLVVYYSGINDARMCNCPKNLYKEDYSHSAWNNEIRCIVSHPELEYVATPFFLDYMYQLVYERLYKDRFMPAHYSQRTNWWNFDAGLNCLKSVKHNIEAITRLSKEKNERLLLLPYCYYLPENYSLEKFKNKDLNYVFQDKSREAEIWGLPANLLVFLHSNNVIIKRSAETYHVDFVPIDLQISGQSKYFADICHFSPEGMLVFSTLLGHNIVCVSHHIYTHLHQ